MRRPIRTRAAILIAAALSLAGCATSFTGDAHFPGGARGCYSKCQADGLQMASFVYMGEYSSGCVCSPPGQATAQPAAAATGAAAVGVVMQMRRQAEQQRQAALQ
jgi:hypothetical protein